MGYLASHRGDYMGGYRGDPGLFGFLGKVVKTGLGLAGKILPGPLGVAARFGSGLFGGGRPAPRFAPIGPMRMSQAMPGGTPIPGMRGFFQRGVPGGATGYRKRRRMNPGNAKALRRAIRRTDAFVKLARRSLKGTGYTISRRGTSRPRTVNIRESGPGGVTVGR